MTTIRIKVLFFASLADRVGVREIELALPFKSGVDEALNVVADRHPELAEVRDTLAFAVNLSYVDQATLLADGDELALIPPVSGG